MSLFFFRLQFDCHPMHLLHFFTFDHIHSLTLPTFGAQNEKKRFYCSTKNANSKIDKSTVLTISSLLFTICLSAG